MTDNISLYWKSSASGFVVTLPQMFSLINLLFYFLSVKWVVQLFIIQPTFHIPEKYRKLFFCYWYCRLSWNYPWFFDTSECRSESTLYIWQEVKVSLTLPSALLRHVRPIFPPIEFSYVFQTPYKCSMNDIKFFIQFQSWLCGVITIFKVF